MGIVAFVISGYKIVVSSGRLVNCRNYNATEYRIRCLGYILNLMVQDFLYVKDIEQAERVSIKDINTN